jgi:FAD synthase
VQIIRHLNEINPATQNAVHHLALGFFDGLHHGHKAVICPKNVDLKHSAVLTFEPHPLAFLAPERKPELITGLPHKIKILESWNIPTLIVLTFDRARSEQSPDQFLTDLELHFPQLKPQLEVWPLSIRQHRHSPRMVQETRSSGIHR